KTDSTHYMISGTNMRSAWSRYPGDGEKKLAAAKAHGARAVFVYEPFDTISATYAVYAAGGFHPPTDLEREKDNVCMAVGTPVVKALMDENTFTTIVSTVRRKAPFVNSFSIPALINYHFKKRRLYATASNVVGYIEGTDKKDEYVVISAHYDHLGKRGC